MWRNVGIAVILTLALIWSEEARAKNRDVEIVSIEATRPAGTVGFTGTVKVHREKPIRGLLLIFEFFDVDRKLLTQQKLLIEEKNVQRGDEVEFELLGDDVPRAVSFRIRVMSSRQMELTVDKGGPYPL
jgi:hypothetical protein